MISLQVAGSLFVYQREAAPKYGFLIMNRNSKENMVEVVTTELTFQKENLVDASQGGAFLLYRYQLKLDLFWTLQSDSCICRKTKPADGSFSIFGIWFCNEVNDNLWQLCAQNWTTSISSTSFSGRVWCGVCENQRHSKGEVLEEDLFYRVQIIMVTSPRFLQDRRPWGRKWMRRRESWLEELASWVSSSSLLLRQAAASQAVSSSRTWDNCSSLLRVRLLLAKLI